MRSYRGPKIIRKKTRRYLHAVLNCHPSTPHPSSTHTLQNSESMLRNELSDDDHVVRTLPLVAVLCFHSLVNENTIFHFIRFKTQSTQTEMLNVRVKESEK